MESEEEEEKKNRLLFLKGCKYSKVVSGSSSFRGWFVPTAKMDSFAIIILAHYSVVSVKYLSSQLGF